MINPKKAIFSGSKVLMYFDGVYTGSTPLVLNNIVGSEELDVNRDIEFKRRARLVLPQKSLVGKVIRESL